VNAAHMAQHPGTFAESVEELTRLWQQLVPETVFRVDASSLLWNVVRSGSQLVAGARGQPRIHGMVDTEPLAEYLGQAMALEGNALSASPRNLERGVLNALAISTTSYTTGQSITWVQGRNIETWKRANRRAISTRMGIDHVMASA